MVAAAYWPAPILPGMRRFLLPEIVARARAEAPVAEVWPLLVDPARHAEWNPLIARVEGAQGPAVGGERVHAVPPEPFGRLPLGPRRIPVDIALVTAPTAPDEAAELGVVAYPLPGLTVRLRVGLVPLPRQRAHLELRLRLAGLLAPAHWPVARVAAAAMARSLAAAAGREREPHPPGSGPPG